MAPPDRWERTVSRLLGEFASSWEVTGVVSVKDDDDQNRLLDFLAKKPEFEAALLHRIRHDTTSLPVLTPLAPPATTPPSTSDPVDILAAPQTEGQAANDVFAQRQPLSLVPQSSGTPSNPLELKAAAAWFGREAESLGIDPRNARDIGYTVSSFLEHLLQAPGNKLAYVHQVGTNHIFEYLKAYSQRPGRAQLVAMSKAPGTDDGNTRPSEDNEDQDRLAPSTMLKRISDLSTFFRLMAGEAKACISNPTDGLANYRKALKKECKNRNASYAPFTEDHFRTLFSPEVYLSATRRADDFWPPLISATTGLRLSEAVCRKLWQITQDPTGLWYFDIRDAKNDNSERAIPVPQMLIDLGFIEYVQHLHNLNAKHLWPHLNLSTKTAIRNPTKKHSERWAEYMDKRGLSDPKLVFHSFRHTVVCALLDDTETGVPLSMQICGHDAQDEAIKRGLLPESARGSVHLATYWHPDMPRLGVESPLLKMKQALDRSIRLPLDISGLKEAARIVTEHVC